MKYFAKKKWGQNFLTDANLLNKIVRTMELETTDNVLEIGPGEGALTERILPKINQMAAIEVDPRLIELLKSEDDLDKCDFIHGDVLWFELKSLPFEPPVKVVGNIPYNITSPILFWLIEQRQFWNEAYIMMQKEVAQRLAGKVGTKTYGRLTVTVGAFLNVDICFHIPPTVFIPKPKVDSTIVRLTKKQIPIVTDEQFPKFEQIVGAAFSKRRKMLRNSMKPFIISDEIKEEIDFTRRPETLTAEEFAKLI